MTIGGHMRSFATKKLFPRSDLFCSSSSPQPQCRAPPLVTPSEVATWVVFGAVYRASAKWLSFHGGHIYEAWMAEKRMHDRLEKLDRKKKESPEAYLEMLHDEIKTMKFVLSRREEVPAWKAKYYKRKAAVLESKLNAWIQREDTAPVPDPQG